MNKLIGVVIFVVSAVIYFGAPNQLRTKENFFLLEKYVGKKLAIRLVGKFEKDDVPMPKIPSLKADATSTDVYSRKEKEVNIPADKKEQLDYIFVTQLMQAVQQRKIENSEASNWMNVLSQGGSREGVYRAMILGDDYGALENYDNAANEAVVNFALSFLEKFVNQTVNPETLGQMNFYSVKRLVCEKALEVLDSYTISEDQASWYANLSKNLALNHAYVFSSETRKNKSAKFHKSWASAVATQHLKSETLLKLHKTFNHLQGN